MVGCCGFGNVVWFGGDAFQELVDLVGFLPNVTFVGPVVGAPFVKNEVMAHAAGRQA